MPFDAVVTVDTKEYELKFGKKPRGFNDWTFKVGHSEIYYSGMYYEAKIYAMERAKDNDIWAIEVKP